MLTIAYRKTLWDLQVKIRFEEINNFSNFERKYGVYKDSVGIDSSYFINNRILRFNIITEAGEIESYSYERIADSIVLNCKVLKQQEKENGYLVPHTLTTFVITFGNGK